MYHFISPTCKRLFHFHPHHLPVIPLLNIWKKFHSQTLKAHVGFSNRIRGAVVHFGPPWFVDSKSSSWFALWFLLERVYHHLRTHQLSQAADHQFILQASFPPSISSEGFSLSQVVMLWDECFSNHFKLLISGINFVPDYFLHQSFKNVWPQFRIWSWQGTLFPVCCMTPLKFQLCIIAKMRNTEDAGPNWPWTGWLWWGEYVSVNIKIFVGIASNSFPTQEILSLKYIMSNIRRKTRDNVKMRQIFG